MDSIVNAEHELGLSYNSSLTDSFAIPYKKCLVPLQIPEIEDFLEVYEKISLTFLYFEDVDKCLNICQKCLDDQSYRFLSENEIAIHENWDEKLFECIFNIQHFLLIKKLDLDPSYAEKKFKNPKFVSKKRFLLYRICENLLSDETAKVMSSVPSLLSEPYTEMYILRVLSCESYYNLFISSLLDLTNTVINSYLEELEPGITIQYQIKNVLNFHNLAPKNVSCEDDIYPIKDSQNVGLCFIINILNIKDYDKREGSLNDVVLLENTMKYFNFNVITFHDVEPEFFINDLNKYINKYFDKKHSVFIMAVMSHGKEGSFYCSNGGPIPINLLKQKLSCERLYEIPKVLIVQACQGDRFLLKGPVTTDGPSNQQHIPTQHKFDMHVSDLLLAVSTVPGFRAFRDCTEGTWFIQTLCKCLKENENDHILNIMTKTIKMVKKFSYEKKKGGRYIGQQPCMTSVLEKQLFLKPLLQK